jgi:hypothetical protein
MFRREATLIREINGSSSETGNSEGARSPPRYYTERTMKLAKVPFGAFVMACCFLAWPGRAAAQRLYNADRDEQAQAALKIAEQLQSGTLFDKQLKNLSLLSKRDMEASLAAARVRMRSEINSFTTWRDVNCVVRRVDQNIKQVREDDDARQADISRRLSELTAAITAANNAYLAMKREVECKKADGTEDADPEKCPELKPGQLDTFFEHAGNLKDIEEAVTFLADSANRHKDVTEAVETAKGVLAALENLYKGYRQRVSEYNNLQGELLGLRLPLKKVTLQALQVEEQYLKSLIKIRARRETEEADILGMIGDYEAFSDLYGFGFSRTAAPPCSPEGADEDFRPSGHRPLRRVREQNIEMSLRDLVARVKHAEAALDRAKAEAAAHEAALLPHEAEVKSRARALRAADAGEARNRARDELGRAREALSAALAKSPDAGRARHEVASQTRLVATLREELSTKLFALHLAAAIAARGEIPRKLAALREAREDHAYSIRKSGVMARAYQLTVSSGVKRLALYHKGGVKPSVVARLVHAAANVAILPILAAK